MPADPRSRRQTNKDTRSRRLTNKDTPLFTLLDLVSRDVAFFGAALAEEIAMRVRMASTRASRGVAGRRTASWQRHVRQQDAYRVFPATRMRWRRAPRDCGDAHTECCVRVWCWIERPLGRDWVCMWHGAGSRGGSGGSGGAGVRLLIDCKISR